MGVGHGHGRRALGIAGGWPVAFGLIAAFFVVELVAALATGSLALMSDAGHMATDVVALGAALVATRIATRRTRPDAARSAPTGPGVRLRTGGAADARGRCLRRGRGGRPARQPGRRGLLGPLIVVGALGLLVNLVALLLLRGGASESLNVKERLPRVARRHRRLGSVWRIAAGWLGARHVQPRRGTPRPPSRSAAVRRGPPR